MAAGLTALILYLELETPIMFPAMSYGSINLNVCRGLAMAARWAIDLMVGYMPNSIP
ncbi:hypothetical protein J7M22_09315 [Candidatus Poribacteria bacterium]|nr:hypothetical protein [Candidatus Poribacteria bacterium]